MFLSAGADGRVRMWDVGQQRGALITWDLGESVGDVAWAPYSATVFAAVTDDGEGGCAGIRPEAPGWHARGGGGGVGARGGWRGMGVLHVARQYAWCRSAGAQLQLWLAPRAAKQEV